METEETESVLTTEPNEEEEEPCYDIDLPKQNVTKEPETKYRVRFKISEANLIIEHITESSSLLMYLKNVTAKFYDRKGIKTFKL